MQTLLNGGPYFEFFFNLFSLFFKNNFWLEDYILQIFCE